MLSAYAFNLDQSKSLSCGKQLMLELSKLKAFTDKKSDVSHLTGFGYLIILTFLNFFTCPTWKHLHMNRLMGKKIEFVFWKWEIT